MSPKLNQLLVKRRINSSKVYCKLLFTALSPLITVVLIVAKCIVNMKIKKIQGEYMMVLIVAKCIVNLYFTDTPFPSVKY